MFHSVHQPSHLERFVPTPGTTGLWRNPSKRARTCEIWVQLTPTWFTYVYALESLFVLISIAWTVMVIRNLLFFLTLVADRIDSLLRLCSFWVYLPTYLPTYLSIYPSIHPSIQVDVCFEYDLCSSILYATFCPPPSTAFLDFRIVWDDGKKLQEPL